MTPSQTIQVRQSEIRERVRVLLEKGELSETETTEKTSLLNEQRELEPKLREALSAEGVDPVIQGEDQEAREKRELRSRASLSGFVLAAVSGRVPDGVNAEYGAAMKSPVGKIPIDLFESDRPRELRAGDVVTPAPATGTGTVVAPIQPFIFSQSIAPRLGIEMPSVGSGAFSEMTITTSESAAAVAKGAAQDSSAGALTAVTAKPRRISARLSVTLEDVASIGQANFESALRQNVQSALSDEYDRQAISGSGIAPNCEGLIAQLADPTDPAALATFDSFLASFADSIDGLWASMLSEVAIVASVDAYKLASKSFRDSTGANGDRGSISFSDYARANLGSWFTNKRMPVTANKLGRGIVYRMGRPGLRTAVHPTWGELSVDDIYSDAASGISHFTVHLLVGSRVLLVQPAAYSLVEWQVKA